jgi:hypothetical protein
MEQKNIFQKMEKKKQFFQMEQFSLLINLKLKQ